MKTTATAVVVVVLLSGCTIPEKLVAVRDARDGGRIAGMDKDSEIQWSGGYAFPVGWTEMHPGPYRSVDEVNAVIAKGPYALKSATFFVGKSRETGRWDVFCVMIQQGDKWLVIPVQPSAKP